MAMNRRLAALGVVLLIGFGSRGIVGLAFHGALPGTSPASESWWDTGYTAYGHMAVEMVEGREEGTASRRAPRPPIYPLLLAGVYWLGGRSTTVPVLVHAAIGTATVLMTYLIGRTAFRPPTGLIAAALAAVYPYYVAHDIAQQETALFTLLVAMTVQALLVARASGGMVAHAGAGVCAGLATLCRESIVPFLPLAAWWLTRRGRRPSGGRTVVGALVFVTALVAVAGPWFLANTARFGAPVFSAGPRNGLGYRVWIGHNAETLSHYPWESIDLSRDQALAALSDADRVLVAGLGDREADRWFLRRALSFAAEDPLRLARYTLVKLFAAFGPLKSPLDSHWSRNVLYTISYVPVCALALLALRSGRDRWPFASLVGLLAVAFLAVVLPTYVHTSHRSYLDVYLMVLAGVTVTNWRARHR
jgi:4-amino-4-deoxy-L-arabinose transferase-like glycosyltransferase